MQVCADFLCSPLHIDSHVCRTHACTHSPTQECNARIQEAIIQCSAIILCKGIYCRTRLETYGLLLPCLGSALSLDHACVVAAMKSVHPTHVIQCSEAKAFANALQCRGDASEADWKNVLCLHPRCPISLGSRKGMRNLISYYPLDLAGILLAIGKIILNMAHS